MKHIASLLLIAPLVAGAGAIRPHAPPGTGSMPGDAPGTMPPERAADTYPKNPAIDALNYAFALTLSDETDVISGEATIDLRFLEAGIDEVRLDLIEQNPDGAGMRVEAVTGADGPMQFEHRGDALFIALARPTEAGERRQITVVYEGVPATGLIIGPNKHGERTFFSDNWPNKARNWLPTIDHPYDKATNELIVTAPAHYQVISNGLLIEETDLLDGTRRSHWKQSVPIATWLYALGAARFAVQTVDYYNGAPIQTWVYAQDRDAGFHDFAVPTKQAMEFYGDMVGPYSYEKLANVQSNSVGGGMEAATAIFYGDASVTGERDVRWRNVIIHEVAHQWFGNAVTEYDWDDVWLSEGFATYFTLLFIEHQYGRDEFIERLKVSRDRIRDFMAENPDYRIVHDNLADMGRVTSGPGTYQKGSWVLHMLRGVVGEDAFWAGIQAYYREFRDGNGVLRPVALPRRVAGVRGWLELRRGGGSHSHRHPAGAGRTLHLPHAGGGRDSPPCGWPARGRSARGHPAASNRSAGRRRAAGPVHDPRSRGAARRHLRSQRVASHGCGLRAALAGRGKIPRQRRER